MFQTRSILCFQRRHPELLAKIREEKHIKTRGSIGQNQNLYASAEKKPKSQMVFKVKVSSAE